MDYFTSYKKPARITLLAVLFLLVASACNLTSAPQEQLELTDVPTNTVLPTRTALSQGAPTPVTVTSLPAPSQPTRVAVLPPPIFSFPTATPLPVSIVILSPIPGNVVASNVQVLGAATHPNFLQYQVEWGSDPNPGNLWFPVGGVRQTPVINGLLDIWNTTSLQDGVYQLRLRVFLRDGTSLATVVNSVRVQNRIPTLVPTATTFPRPIAAFSQDRFSGLAPLVVRFINQSSGNITSRSWDFGDGGGSSELNPIHTFRNPGVYTVKLTVRGPGGTSNVSRQISVQSATPPVAGFTQDQTSGPSPLTVQFTDQSTGNITTRTWNFGDGESSNEVSPAHTFNDVGTYNVILTVTGPGGSSSVTRQITVENPTIPEPIAALVPNRTEGDAPLTVQFDATDSSGQIDSYNWDFGDGELGNGQIVTHTFENPGEYEVALTVVGPGGQSTRSTIITVTQPPDAPDAIFTQDQTSGDVPLTVNFDASGSTGPIDSYNWNFGDGNVGSGTTVQHIYSTAGTYTVELVVNGPGGTDSATVEISAVEPIAPPEAAFESVPSSGLAPLEVAFNNQSIGEELTFSWDFGDGTEASTDRDPVHTFENPGEYQITLVVNNPSGTDQANATIIVTEPEAPPAAAFTAFPESGPAPLSVQFTNGTAGDDLTFSWDFSDGSPASTDRDPQHIFDTPGNYIVILTVTGPGGSDTAELTISVGPPVPAPDAAFTADPTSGEAPLTVSFDSTGDPANITAYNWDFGDGNFSTEADPQYIYASSGNFTTRLTVTGLDGREATTETQIAVSEAVVIAPPVPAFSAEPVSGSVGQPVQFTNQTTGDVSDYVWDFGDGSPVVTDANPAHIFNVAGDFTVVLTANGPGGSAQASAVYSVAAPAQPPVPAFSAEPVNGSVGQPVQFTNQTTGDVSDYVWDFGDGSPVVTDANPTYTFNSAGDFTVVLTANGPGGSAQASAVYSVAAPAQPPVPAFSAEPVNGSLGQPVQFTNQTTGDVSDYMWDFGDGSPVVTDANPTYTFNSAGDFTVVLTANGPGGSAQASAVYSVAAPAQPPVPAFSAEPVSGSVGQPVQFTNQTTGDVSDYVWDFGDGSPVVTDANPTYIFNVAGDFTVVLTANGPGGSAQASAVYSVAAPAQPPVPAFSAEPVSGSVGQPVQFTNQTTGDVSDYVWDFGDGSPIVTDANPAHIFNVAGDFTVVLTANGPGGSAQASTVYSVAAPAQPPVPAFSAEPVSGSVGQPVQFTNQTTGDVSDYVWDFGDGSPVVTDANPTYTFNSAGDFTVVLTANGPGGSAQASTVYSVAAPAQPPVPAFSAEPVSGSVGQPVQFTNQTTGDVSDYVWDFGDGSPIVTDANPAHIFNVAGDFTVVLTANGPGGSAQASTVYSVAAPAQPPVPAFSAEPVSGSVGQPVQFTNQTTGDVSDYVWDFGDGSPIVTDANPAHIFNVAGDFTVVLTANGPGGSAQASTVYSVADVPQQPSIIEQIPILPDFSSPQVQAQLRAIYDNGISQGRRAAVFAVIGDDMALQNGYLDPFADTNLDSSASGLQGIIDWYNIIDLGNGQTSFNRASVAAGNGWRVRDLLDPAQSNGGVCNGGETPLDCELRIMQPSVVIVSIGINDVNNGNPDRFPNELEQVLQTLLNNGVIPIVTTVQPNPANAANVVSLNERLVAAVQNVEAANNTTIPVYNLWRAYGQLPGTGLEGDNRTPTTSPAGPAALTPDAVGTFGTNTRNHNVLTILSQLANTIFPDATP